LFLGSYSSIPAATTQVQWYVVSCINEPLPMTTYTTTTINNGADDDTVSASSITSLTGITSAGLAITVIILLIVLLQGLGACTRNPALAHQETKSFEMAEKA
jgi:hypothetical protein